MSNDTTRSESRDGRGLVGDIGIALVCLLVYVVCGQNTLHGTDSENFVSWLKVDDRDAYPRHAAFLPLTCSLYALLRPLGVSAFHTLLLASAAGSSLGTLGIVRAARLLLPPGASPRLTGLLVAATPTWLFYATAAELHGVFAAGLGLSWWTFARWWRRPTPVGAAAIGVAVGTAAALHGLGVLLLPMFVGFAVVRRVHSWRVICGHWTVAIVAQLAIAMLLSWWFAGDVDGQSAGALTWLNAWTSVFAVAELPAVVWRELVTPYLPCCAVAIVAFGSARTRPWARWWLVAFALHAPVAVLLLARPLQIDEHGAYLLPVAVPGALAAAVVLPRRWLCGVLAASVAWALFAVAPEWPRSYDEDYLRGIAELRRERPFALLVGRFAEIEAVAIETDGQPVLDVNRALWQILDQRAAGTGAPLAAWFDAAFAMFAAAGNPLFVTEGGREALVGSADDEVRRLWPEHIETGYDLLPEQRAGLRGWFLRPRAR